MKLYYHKTDGGAEYYSTTTGTGRGRSRESLCALTATRSSCSSTR